jgi:hypothetical protein
MQQYALHAGFGPSSEGLTAAAIRERDHIEALARRLYILAWVIEGVAVALGLGMALSLNLPGESSFGEFLLGGGGFVMIACAELSKIPLATFFVETPGRSARLQPLLSSPDELFTFETILCRWSAAGSWRFKPKRATRDDSNRTQQTASP